MTVETGRRHRKRLVRDYLSTWQMPRLVAAALGDRTISSTLVAFLVDVDNQLRWRAIHALGLVAALRAESGVESVRDLLRRQFWAMNDDSGNAVEHAPEAIAEILFRVPALCPEYATNLFSHLETRIFRAGVAWGMARVADLCPSALAECASQLLAAVDDLDPRVRGYAGVSVVHIAQHHRGRRRPSMGSPACVPDDLEAAARFLVRDDAQLEVFDEATGAVQPTTVGALVTAVMHQLGQARDGQ